MEPARGMVALTLVLTVFFIVDGVLIILLALEHRRELTPRWQWMMVNGLIDLILAGIIIYGLPGTLLWAWSSRRHRHAVRWRIADRDSAGGLQRGLEERMRCPRSNRWNWSGIAMAIVADVKRLIEKYRAIFDWDVPDIDQPAADRLILVEVRKALDDVEGQLLG